MAVFLPRRCTLKLLAFTAAFSFLSFLVALRTAFHVESSQQQQQQQADLTPLGDAVLLTDLLRAESPHRGKVKDVFRTCANELTFQGRVDENKTDVLLNCFLGALKSAQYSQTVPALPDPVREFLSLPIVNPHNPDFLIDSSGACAQRAVETLFVSPSAPEYFERRQAVRSSNRGLYVKDKHNNAALLFFVGLPSEDPTGKVLEEIRTESTTYGDIVLVRFEDKYKNILQKALAMLRWAIDFCPNAEHVIRTDDDVNVTVTDLISVMRRVHKQNANFVIGKRMVNDVPARSNNKWHLSEEEYPETTFPPYVLGGLIGYPLTTVRLLYEATLRLKSIWLDDVYVTGLCARKLNIPVLEDERFVFQHQLKKGDFEEQT
ncbi:beta-1,3-galactosyltransferase 1 [Aplysia californica]|uniref:Hexosyltransferase n=1 Tax=Aplysia californica TaxID=6500 RepID=A0ABM0K3T7_APLCA|nr:beta-1,3-galactosyltransferase 1 [Aplysia californica]